MRLKDLINPVRWFSYCTFLSRKLSGFFLEKFGFNTPEDLSWKSEVIVYRGLLCEDCKNAGKCVGIREGESESCGCDFIGKSTDMSEGCSLGIWPPVKNKEDWENKKNTLFKNTKIGFINEVE
jgi:hypothetical protein